MARLNCYFYALFPQMGDLTCVTRLRPWIRALLRKEVVIGRRKAELKGAPERWVGKLEFIYHLLFFLLFAHDISASNVLNPSPTLHPAQAGFAPSLKMTWRFQLRRLRNIQVARAPPVQPSRYR